MSDKQFQYIISIRSTMSIEIIDVIMKKIAVDKELGEEEKTELILFCDGVKAIIYEYINE